jgi:hypothetical protein
MIDVFKSRRWTPAVIFPSMISAQTLRVCREENRLPLFRIML